MSLPPDLCVLPLSSPYSLLPRTHTYAMIIALLLPLPRGWLWRAALAGFTTKTAIFAVDAIVHLSTIRKHPDHPVPLDVLVCLEMLALASMVALWLLVVSRAASLSAARGLIRTWALGVAVGCVVAFVGVKSVAGLDSASFASESDGVRVCPEYSVPMPTGSILGEKVEKFSIGTYPSRIGHFMLSMVGIAGLIFASLTMLSISADGPGYKMPAKVADLEDNTLEVINAQAFGQEETKRLVRIARYFLGVAIPANVIFVAWATETYLSGMVPDVPETEPLSSVGQWGVWAATGVVLLGTFVNAMRERMGLKEPQVMVGSSMATMEQRPALGTD